jgi:hypothetical protein
MTEDEIFADYVQFTMQRLTPFSSINEQDLFRMMFFFHRAEMDSYCWRYYDEYVESINSTQTMHIYSSEEITELLGHMYSSARGITPAHLQKWVRENINPNFSIESYDYKSLTQPEEMHGIVWDSDRGMIVYYANASCGSSISSPGYINVIDVQKSGGTYHVYAVRTTAGWGILSDIDVVCGTFVKNSSGGFNITSLQPADIALAPDEWVRDYIALREKLMNDPALAYGYMHEWHENPRTCDCDNTTGRTLCDYCILWEIPLILTEMFREHSGIE